MVEGVTVKFRWFRTVQVDSNTPASLISVDHKWEDIELSWDSLKRLYESGPTYMACGRHSASILVADQLHECEPFTVVATTIEVNIFLANVDIPMNVMSNDARKSVWQNVTGLSMSPRCVLSEPVSIKSPIYEEALAAKDKEIDYLRYQVEQLKCALIASDVDRRSAIEARNSAIDNEFEEAACEFRCMVDGYEDNNDDDGDEDTNDSLECEVRRLRARLCGNDPAEVEQLLEEMRLLRKELQVCCRKNKALGEEVLILRADNTRLNRGINSIEAMRSEKTRSMGYVCCNSDPESSSTQYQKLPIERSSISLPALLGSPLSRDGGVYESNALGEHCKIIRRPSVKCPESPVSCNDSISLFTDDLLSYGTPPLSIGSTGVQTDITAVAGKPKRLKSRGEAKRRLFRDEQRKQDVVSGRANSLYKDYKTSYHAEEPDIDSDDTEELLTEADNFVTMVFGSEIAENKKSTNKLFVKRLTPLNYGVPSKTNDVKERIRPFIPKCAAEVHVGHRIRFLGPAGLVIQGKVTFVGPVSDRNGIFIGVESGECNYSQRQSASSSIVESFVPFKKVILAWQCPG